MRKNRNINQLRDTEIVPNFSPYPEGSCLIKCGNTHVVCSASLDQNVPRWLKNSGSGWVTAEYGMIPRSTSERMSREAARGKQSGRTQEIQRLIGRSLRSVIDLEELKDSQIIIDCDVIQADGGTRTASISGAFVALQLCIEKMLNKKIIKKNPIRENIAAISCGIINGEPLLDLDFDEDQNAGVDANFVITETGKLVEVQMTSEKQLCSEESFYTMLKLAKSGVTEIIQIQKKIVSG
jgi:ribonuclease PH